MIVFNDVIIIPWCFLIHFYGVELNPTEVIPTLK